MYIISICKFLSIVHSLYHYNQDRDQPDLMSECLVQHPVHLTMMKMQHRTIIRHSMQQTGGGDLAINKIRVLQFYLI